ncbi:MAG: hypothetical protein IPP17_19385 [Bacteroidetes bacterium]|nr:hypothetical protein [Bacteroidota bacterium]
MPRNRVAAQVISRETPAPIGKTATKRPKLWAWTGFVPLLQGFDVLEKDLFWW